MGRLARTSIAAALGALAVAAISACGEEDAKLLPGETAREITANLEAVQQLSDEGDCLGAESAAQQVSEQVESLGGVDRKLKEALRDGADRLTEVVDECEEEVAEAPAQAEVPTTGEDKKPSDEAADKEEEEEQEKAEKEREKEEEKAEKEREKEEEKAEKEREKEEGTEEAPPQEAPSGGVESASPVEGEQGDH
jgi:outer membrane biosynthesis protein TonB